MPRRPGPHRPPFFHSDETEAARGAWRRRHCFLWLHSAAIGPIAGKRTRSQLELRTQRRRDVMQRLPAIAAMFLRDRIDPQPMSASCAARIDALYGPARQIAHAASAEQRFFEWSDRILRRYYCGVKHKPTICSSILALLWKSVLPQAHLRPRPPSPNTPDAVI